ncbi:hypothetical protein SCAR479_05297 [Seiridium cardinale]|uniref:Uncharacterized protein n=1 Tax=Seiridium cardinale TaxID=138064 RepID=A0ABR2XWG3_9PEZI
MSSVRGAVVSEERELRQMTILPGTIAHRELMAFQDYSTEVSAAQDPGCDIERSRRRKLAQFLVWGLHNMQLGGSSFPICKNRKTLHLTGPLGPQDAARFASIRAWAFKTSHNSYIDGAYMQ